MKTKHSIQLSIQLRLMLRMRLITPDVDHVNENQQLVHFGKYHISLCLSPKILHKHCIQFLLGLTMVPRENTNNAYAKFGGTNKGYYGIFRSGLIVGFHSRDPQLCFSTKTKENICIIIELNSRRICSGLQHGRRFFV